LKNQAILNEKEETEKQTSDTNIRISKIKYDGKETEVHYIEWSGETGIDTKETVFKSLDMPHSDFINALEDLTPELLFLLELPDEYAGNMNTRGISLGQGAVITAVKKFPDLGNKALCLNTPYLEFEANCKEGIIGLPKRTELMIKKVEGEAKLFMEGKRKNMQGKLQLVT